MVRLVALDLDDTLLTTDKRIAPEDREALKAAQLAGDVLAVGCWLVFVVDYVVRLAYPWRTWPRDVTSWRTPRLVIDLRAA